jgi:hypothetical protein
MMLPLDEPSFLASAQVDSMQVESFEGDGLNVHASNPNSNANGWAARKLRVAHVHGHGVYTAGDVAAPRWLWNHTAYDVTVRGSATDTGVVIAAGMACTIVSDGTHARRVTPQVDPVA